MDFNVSKCVLMHIVEKKSVLMSNDIWGKSIGEERDGGEGGSYIATEGFRVKMMMIMIIIIIIIIIIMIITMVKILKVIIILIIIIIIFITPLIIIIIISVRATLQD